MRSSSSSFQIPTQTEEIIIIFAKMSTSTIGKSSRDCNAKVKNSSTESYKAKMKRDKAYQTKVKLVYIFFVYLICFLLLITKFYLTPQVVIRRLPPTMTEEQFVEQISPLPDHDYMYFVKADMR